MMEWIWMGYKLEEKRIKKIKEARLNETLKGKGRE